MHTFISLLRGINVSGQKTIRMPELKALYESLGFTQVTTYLQSGNVVFDCADREASTVRGSIEKEIERHFSFSVSVLLRDRDDFQRIIGGNPFLAQRNEDPERLHVTFLSALPSALALKDLETPIDTTDEYFLSGKEVYLFCPNGYGRTKLSNNFFERKLKVAATTRNWKTVNALVDIMNSR
jgi:uncharacterized protein (DUF1697 family)